MRLLHEEHTHRGTKDNKGYMRATHRTSATNKQAQNYYQPLKTVCLKSGWCVHGCDKSLVRDMIQLFHIPAEGGALIFHPSVKLMTNRYGDFSRLVFDNSRVAAGSTSSDTLLFIFGLSKVIIHIDRKKKQVKEEKREHLG